MAVFLNLFLFVADSIYFVISSVFSSTLYFLFLIYTVLSFT